MIVCLPKPVGINLRVLIHETRGVVDFIMYDNEQVFLAAMFRHIGICVFLLAHGCGRMCTALDVVGL
jgi:hypothetical protein